jgi:hypothetical protein
MILQLSYLSIASLVVQHAAVVAARSACVILPDDPMAFTDNSPINSADADGDRMKTITDAANFTLGALQPLPLQGTGFNPTVKVTLMKSGSPASDFDRIDEKDPNVIQASVSYQYTCGVMFGGSLICGTGGSMTLSGLAAMPNQGADYAFY